MKIASFLIRFPLFLFLLGTVGMLCNVPMNPAWSIISVLISGYLLYKEDRNHFIGNFLISIFILVLFVVFAVYQYDYSFDGQWYHSAVEYLFAHHWNPIYDGNVRGGLYEINNSQIWINHYAKGYELIASGVVSLTGYMESGKSVNLIWLTSALIASYYCLKEFLNLDKCKTIIIDCIINFNPVVLNQVFTNYIDWILYTMLVLTFCNLYHYKRYKDVGSLLNIFLIIFFIPSTKFNAAFWYFAFTLVGLFLFFPGLFTRKIIIEGLVTVMMGFLIGGFSPYITNTLNDGNPFYPLVGKNKVDIMASQLPTPIKNKNNFEAVNLSLVSNPFSSHGNKTNIIKVSKGDVKESVLTDTRLGGFGIFFFESTAFLIILFIIEYKNKEMYHIWVRVLISILLLYASLFVLPSGWWARYVPFFYFVPIIIFLYLLKSNIGFSKKILWIPVGLLLIDICISFAGVGAQSLKQRMQIDYLIKVCEESKQPIKLCTSNYTFIYKLEEHGIRYEIIPNSKRLCQVIASGVSINFEPRILEKSHNLPNKFMRKYFPLKIRKY